MDIRFPEALTKHRNWVCWKAVPDQRKGRIRKVPMNARTGQAASSTDSTTWCSVEEALEGCKRFLYPGVGFVFTPETGLVGVDIDHCIDPQTHEYAVVQLIEDSAERQSALEALNQRYNENRLAAAREYAQTLAGVVMPVWEQEDIQQANQQVDTLLTKLREYSMAGEGEKPAILQDLADLSAEMDEGALTEYLGLLTQIQSLLDGGMSEEEVQAMFPDIDVSGLMDRALAVLSGNAGLQLVGQVLGQRSRRKHRPRRARQQHEIGLQRRHRGGHFRVCGRAGRRHPAGPADQRGRSDQPAEHRDLLKRPRRDRHRRAHQGGRGAGHDRGRLGYGCRNRCRKP